MNTILFDTETSGKADMRADYDAPHQPRIVQLAAILMSGLEREIMSINVIIRPDGFTIPVEASSIHGITTDFAEAVGIPIKTALNMFRRMKRSAETYVAHNIDFDRFMVLSEIARLKQEGDAARIEDIIPREACFCTMKAMTDVCKLPGPYGFKWPKLQEAHKHAFGAEFDGAHDALSDVRACSKVYFWINAQGAPKPVEAAV